MGLAVSRRLVAVLVPLGLAGLLALAVFCLGFCYLNDRKADPFSSDNLLCNALCEDVLRGADLSGWSFPGAPYLFPDALLLLPCQRWCPNLVAVYFAYDALFYGALLATLVWLARQLGLGRRGAFVAAAAGLSFLLVAHLRDAYRDVGQLMGHPGNHLGAVLVGVLLTALTARALRRGAHGWVGAAAFVLCGGLGALSDKLLLVQFMLPGCLALVALALCRGVTPVRLLRHVALVGAAVLLAEGLQQLLAHQGCQFEGVSQGLRRPRLEQLGPLLRQLGTSLKERRLLLALLPLHLFAVLLVLGAWRRRRELGERQAGQGPAGPFMALTVLLSPVCNVLALFATGQPAAYRYCLAVHFLPFLFPFLLLRLLPGRAARLGSGLLLACVAGLALHQLRLLLPTVSRNGLAQPYPPLAEAIDRLVQEHGPLRGLAGFWTARRLSFLTRSRTPVLPIDTGGAPFVHASNANGFLDPRPGELAVPAYRLLVVSPGQELAAHPDVLRAQFGEPRRKVRVGPDQLWLYDRLDNPLLARCLRSQMARRLRRALPYVAPAAPALARPREAGTALTARGLQWLAPGEPLEVRFARPVAARLLDVAAGAADRVRLRFYRGGEAVGTLEAPPALWPWPLAGPPGLRSRLLEVPPGLRARPWDRVVVESAAPASVCLGHLLAFEQQPPGLTTSPACPAAPGPERHRFSAAALVSVPGPAGLVADPEAAAGHAWRAPDGFTGPLTAPLLALRPGRYHVDFTLKVDDNSSAAPAVRLVAGAPARPCVRVLRGADFAAPGRYATFRVTFDAPEAVDFIPFRLEALGPAHVTLGHIDLTRCPAAGD
jgi:hypothetical protein